VRWRVRPPVVPQAAAIGAPRCRHRPGPHGPAQRRQGEGVCDPGRQLRDILERQRVPRGGAQGRCAHYDPILVGWRTVLCWQGPGQQGLHGGDRWRRVGRVSRACDG